MRRKPKECERHQREARSDERRERSASTWYRIDHNSLRDRRLDQFKARIGDTGRSGVRDESDTRACLETDYQLGHPRSGVMSVEADGSRRNRVVIQQPGCSPRVLDGDDVNLAQNAKRPERDVFEISDGGGEHI